MSKSYSMKFNHREKAWIARVKTLEGAWKTKWLPVRFGSAQEVEAELYLIQWYAEFLKQSGGQTPITITGSGKTLANMADRWLKYREEDNTGTKINTYNGFKRSMRNWLLDNPKFPHERIEHVDLETEFTVDVTRRWIQSLGGSYSSRIQHINTLKSFFNDCIGNEWLNGEMMSPLDKKPIKKLIKRMQESMRRERVITVFTNDQIQTALAKEHRKVKDSRRIRYLTAVGTGMRKEELQGAVWSDFNLDTPIPYVKVDRQLYKIGQAPFERWEELAEKGFTKAQAMAIASALVTDPKKNSNRIIPLHPLVVVALKWWKKKGWQLEVGRKPEPGDPVFPRNKVSLRGKARAGDFTAINDASATLRLDLKRLRLPLESNGKPLTFHSFRHTFATMLEEAGVSQERRDHLMGHKPKTVAAANYVAKNLAAYAEEIAKIPLGESLTLSRDTLRVSPSKSAAANDASASALAGTAAPVARRK